MKHWLFKYRIPILFLFAHLIYLVMNIIGPLVTEGMNLDIFDLRMFGGYDLTYITQFNQEISDQGRRIYLFVQLPLDFIYPLLTSLFFYAYFKQEFKVKKLAAIGFLSMTFDYMENIFVIFFLTSSHLTSGFVMIGSISTILKGIFYLINYGLSLFFLSRCIVKRIIKKTSGTK
ncbi:MAG TPA: hypothetical protein DEG42_05625 [Acholeplasmataceae bacterium]|nr:MAG: hypothetical protein A2Y43_01450 [Tenericutes bacterium GWA2_38_26]OHE30644.1 MAG: hypothetical protein A2084_02690 [Tenericutes bacterium GWC2_39_45]OHE36335.1 MAG: hypothetical protein A2013_05085 [Tenericutes bacterium GWE2_38_8]HBY65838.1 hypothetical protein [Acholeplasmataceae bacterium]